MSQGNHRPGCIRLLSGGYVSGRGTGCIAARNLSAASARIVCLVSSNPAGSILDYMQAYGPSHICLCRSHPCTAYRPRAACAPPHAGFGEMMPFFGQGRDFFGQVMRIFGEASPAMPQKPCVPRLPPSPGGPNNILSKIILRGAGHMPLPAPLLKNLLRWKKESKPDPPLFPLPS